jgi:hypothetical protein
MHTYNATKYAERKTKIQAAKNAVATLDTIIANVEGANIAQSQTAIKQIAQHQKALIRIVVGEVI